MGMPSYVTPGGAPSSAKAKRCSPAGVPSIAFGTGSAQSGVGPSANRVMRAPAGAATSTMTRRPPAPSSRRTDLMASGALSASTTFFRTRRLRRGEGSVLRRRTAGQHEIGLSFGRHAQRLAHRIVELETQLDRFRAILRHDRKRQDDVAGISNRDQVVFRDGL